MTPDKSLNAVGRSNSSIEILTFASIIALRIMYIMLNRVWVAGSDARFATYDPNTIKHSVWRFDLLHSPAAQCNTKLMSEGC
jgi:hypothetical protein